MSWFGPRQDLTGQKKGRITLVRWMGGGRWETRCDCGAVGSVATSNFTSGQALSCGCKQGAWKHGGAGHNGDRAPEYRVWVKMKSRCLDSGSGNYQDYGGRGIRVCQAWLDSFAQFRADVGPRPSMRHTLDRINVNGHYEPANTRWATPAEQARNTRRNIFVDLGGKRLCVKDAAAFLGVPYGTVRGRMRRGLAPLEALGVSNAG